MKTINTKVQKKGTKKEAKKQLESSLTEKLLEAVKSLGHDAERIAEDIAQASKKLAKKLTKKIKQAKNAVAIGKAGSTTQSLQVPTIQSEEKVAKAIAIPVIANGGAGSVADIAAVINEGKASAAALGSMVVYQRQGMGVLVNFPDKSMLSQALR